MRVTAADLRRKKACSGQVAIFEAEWPDGVEVTEASLLRASSLRLALWWFVKHYLPSSLWAEWERQVVPIWEACLRRVIPIWEEYEQVALIWEEYERRVALITWRLLKDAEGSK